MYQKFKESFTLAVYIILYREPLQNVAFSKKKKTPNKDDP